MKRIGILSDTHAHWDERFAHYFAACDEIWHAGDIGNMDVILHLQQICHVRAVCGNIDGGELRSTFPQILSWQCEGAHVMMTHIGGYPGKYAPSIRQRLLAEKPNLFISGHSHILKVMFDEKLSCLHINPGAAGLQGWQKVRTIIRLCITDGQFHDLEVIEL